MGQKGARRRPRRSRSRKTARRPGSGRWRRWGIRLAGLVVAGGLIFLAVTYVQVRLTFHHRLGGEPSRIYSDSLVLRPGMGWTAPGLEAELVSRGYRASPDWTAAPGRFRRDGASLRIYLNSFEYPGEPVDGYRARVRFVNDRILSLEMDADGSDLDLLMVEPRLLDTFYGRRHQIRFPEPLASLPPALIQAVLEVEDRRFRAHGGLDLRGITRAAWQDLRHRYGGGGEREAIADQGLARLARAAGSTQQ